MFRFDFKKTERNISFTVGFFLERDVMIDCEITKERYKVVLQNMFYIFVWYV